MGNTGALLWNIEKLVSKGDYNYAVVRDHPNATVHGYVLHHRVVMENHLGRLLNANEVVHHINESKKDNRIDNLQLMTMAEHASLHGNQKGRTMMECKCPNCNIIFHRDKRKTHVGKKMGNYTCCSPRCRGQFSRKIQLQGLTQELQSAISVNILREYHSLDNTEGTLLQGTP